MKRLVLALGLTLALALTACSGGGEETQTTPTPDAGGGDVTQNTPAAGENTPDSSTPEASGESYVFLTPDGVEVPVNADMSQLLEQLGEAQTYFEAESCAFEGLDKTYTYPGFVITTRPEGEQDLVNSVRLTDDSVTTQEGAYIGMEEAAVKELYGDEGEESTNLLIYTQGDCALNILLDSGKVVSIEYLTA